MLNILDKWLCGTYAEKKLIAEKNEEIQEHIRKLEFQASHDSFTGVLNKTAIFKQADDIIKDKEDAVHGILLLDIDIHILDAQLVLRKNYSYRHFLNQQNFL